MFPFRIAYADGECLYGVIGNRILYSDNAGEKWKLYKRLPICFLNRIAMRIPFLSRLLRLGIHHVGFVNDKMVVFANKETYLLDYNEIVPLGRVHGSRPMVLCESEDGLYYGEYRSNPERSPVYIYMLSGSCHRWVPVWEFQNVRHIHGVFYDKYTNSHWVTTGDSDEEAAIWRSEDGFKTLYKVVGGSQQFRAVQLLFTEDYLYFGSDAPEELNNIYRLDRADLTVERLAVVGGPVFYGCKVGGRLFFSTSVEPSAINDGDYVEVWSSINGVDWKLFERFKKDLLSKKYFQYGQALFINGRDNGSLYLTPFATKYHGYTFRYNFKY